MSLGWWAISWLSPKPWPQGVPWAMKSLGSFCYLWDGVMIWQSQGTRTRKLVCMLEASAGSEDGDLSQERQLQRNTFHPRKKKNTLQIPRLDPKFYASGAMSQFWHPFKWLPYTYLFSTYLAVGERDMSCLKYETYQREQITHPVLTHPLKMNIPKLFLINFTKKKTAKVLQHLHNKGCLFLNS